MQFKGKQEEKAAILMLLSEISASSLAHMNDLTEVRELLKTDWDIQSLCQAVGLEAIYQAITNR